MAIAILHREELREYDFGPGHPFRGDRYEIFPKFLRENLGEDDNYRILSADSATEEELLLICNKDYINFTRDYFKAANLGLSQADSFNFPQYHSLDNLPRSRPGKLEEAARLMVGQAKMAADLVEAAEYKKVVCIGGNMHHAKPNYGEGFCLYNDNAFAAKYLIEKYGLERILILDTDAHQGNGTCEYFYFDPKVLFIDLHQDPRTLYPGTGFAQEIGEGVGKGHTINVPMPIYAGYDSYQLVFEEIIQPVVGEFKPQIIIRNGGSDPHFADGLTNLGLTIKGFEMIGQKVREMAEICQGKQIDIIGSGYNKEVLPYAWLALISGLANFDVAVEEPVPIPQRFQTDSSFEETRGVVDEVKKYHKDYWNCFH
ncbi:MAG: histone deacetylase [Chloroflexota bacterium]|nr:histone deacetylase [Chloroflexota bacterium]